MSLQQSTMTVDNLLLLLLFLFRILRGGHSANKYNLDIIFLNADIQEIESLKEM